MAAPEDNAVRAVLQWWLRHRHDAPNTLAVFRSRWALPAWLSCFPALGVLLAWSFESRGVLWFFVGSAVGLLVRDYIAASASSLGWPITRDYLDWKKVEQAMEPNNGGEHDAGQQAAAADGPKSPAR